MEQQFLDFVKSTNVLTWFFFGSYFLSPILFKLFAKVQRYESGNTYAHYVNERNGFSDRLAVFIFFLLSPLLIFPLLVMLMVSGFIMGFPAFIRWMSDLPVSKNKMNQIINEFQSKKVVYSQQKVEIPVAQRPGIK